LLADRTRFQRNARPYITAIGKTETPLKKSEILFVEDDPRDVDLALAALEAVNLASKVAVVENGQQALDYLYCRGNLKGARAAILPSFCSTTKCRWSAGWRCKTDDHLKTISVVALTSSRDTSDLVEFYKHALNA
jgi:hypothetical protein